MERDLIIKALECCTRGRKSKDDRPCLDCPYNECNLVGGTSERQTTGTCQGWLMKDALSLINELTEENERLKAENENKCKDCAGCIADKCDCANIEAYAVEKYKSAIIEYYSKPKYQPTKEHPIKHTQIEYLFAVLDQIAKEMLEGMK